MSNTKIVLNRQSDLILDNAQITAPVGIVKADIPELVDNLSELVAADNELKKAAAEQQKELATSKGRIDGLDGKLITESGRIDAILDASEADKDSFAEIVALINSVDTENDTAFAGYVLSNDAALSTEVARAESAETSLETELGVGIEKLRSVAEGMKLFVGELDKKLFEEAELRAAGDALLDGKIADIISNTDITSMDSFSEVSAELEANFSDLTAELEAQVSSLIENDTFIVNTANNAIGVLGYNIQELYNFVESVKPSMRGFNELPDGVKTVFTTSVVEGQIVFLNGLMQLEEVDYTMVSSFGGEGAMVSSFGGERTMVSSFGGKVTVTFTSAPATTDKLNIYGISYSEYNPDSSDSISVDGSGSDGFGLRDSLNDPDGYLSDPISVLSQV